jgi:hypothetical protein
MRTFIANLAFAVAASVCTVGTMGTMAGCTADVHDNTLDVHDNTANIDNAKVEFETTADTENISAGQAVHVTIVAEDVFLIDPSETPPPDRVMVAGHFEFFLDSMSSTALLVTAEESVDVMIPTTATAGDHKLLCRIAKHDGTPTEATFELDIKVKASVSVN